MSLKNKITASCFSIIMLLLGVPASLAADDSDNDSIEERKNELTEEEIETLEALRNEFLAVTGDPFAPPPDSMPPPLLPGMRQNGGDRIFPGFGDFQNSLLFVGSTGSTGGASVGGTFRGNRQPDASAQGLDNPRTYTEAVKEEIARISREEWGPEDTRYLSHLLSNARYKKALQDPELKELLYSLFFTTNLATLEEIGLHDMLALGERLGLDFVELLADLAGSEDLNHFTELLEYVPSIDKEALLRRMLLSQYGASCHFMDDLRWHTVEGLFSTFCFSFEDLIQILSVKNNEYTNIDALGFMLAHGATINLDIRDQESLYTLLLRLNGAIEREFGDVTGPQEIEPSDANHCTQRAINTLLNMAFPGDSQWQCLYWVLNTVNGILNLDCNHENRTWGSIQAGEARECLTSIFGKTMDLEALDPGTFIQSLQWLLYYLVQILPFDGVSMEGLGEAESQDLSFALRTLSALKTLHLTYNVSLTFEDEDHYGLILNQLFARLNPGSTQDTMSRLRFAVENGFGDILAEDLIRKLTVTLSHLEFEPVAVNILTLALECEDLPTMQAIVDYIANHMKPLAEEGLLDPYILSDYDSLNLLKLALKMQNMSFFKALLRDIHGRPLVNINATDTEGRNILHYVALQGLTELFQDLVDLGANPNGVDRFGALPQEYLEMQLALEENPEIFEVLINDHPRPEHEAGEANDEPPAKRRKRI